MPSGVDSKTPLLMAYQIITKAQQQRSDWAGGCTIQLAIHPADASLAERNFAWRLSSATVNQSGAFSQFLGFGRWLGIRQGNGMTLDVDLHRIDLREKTHMVWFSGDAKTCAQLRDGPVTDINLILADGWHGGMQALELTETSQQLAVPNVADELLLYVDSGSLQLTLGDQRLSLETGEVLRGNAQELAELQASANLGCASAVLVWLAPC